MRAPFLAVVCALTLVGGCGSSLNPRNWFGGAAPDPTIAANPAEAINASWPLVDEVTEMAVERVPGGAIVRATGLPPRQGYWLAGLVADSGAPMENGVLILNLRSAPPPQPTPVGTPSSRVMTAALYLSDQSLVGVRTIVVRGARNERSARP